MPVSGNISTIETNWTPIVGELLIQTFADTSRERYRDLKWGDPHPDTDRWPDHELVDRKPAPEKGDHHEALYWVAKPRKQDAYNFSHTVANLGSAKFDAVERTYIIKRDDYSSTVPALGITMPDVPAGLFGDSSGASHYQLIARQQSRVSERSGNIQGPASLDSLYVVEVRTFFDRATITEALGFDDATGANLNRSHDIYIRGENYSNSNDATVVAIELATEDDSAGNDYWGVNSTGQQITFQQLSEDVWVVSTQDLIAQTLTSVGAIWGGKVVKIFETSANYSWPAVLGSDGVPEDTGALGVEIMDYEDKEGGFRNYPRPRYKRPAVSHPTRGEIHREWVTQAQLDAVEGSGGTLDIITHLDARGVYYPSPYLTVNLPPSLHGSTALTCNTAASDPTWGANTGSTRTYPATSQTDWPDHVIADISVQEWRGGYLVTQAKVYKPRT